MTEMLMTGVSGSIRYRLSEPLCYQALDGGGMYLSYSPELELEQTGTSAEEARARLVNLMGVYLNQLYSGGKMRVELYAKGFRSMASTSTGGLCYVKTNGRAYGLVESKVDRVSRIGRVDLSNPVPIVYYRDGDDSVAEAPHFGRARRSDRSDRSDARYDAVTDLHRRLELDIRQAVVGHDGDDNMPLFIARSRVCGRFVDTRQLRVAMALGEKIRDLFNWKGVSGVPVHDDGDPYGWYLRTGTLPGMGDERGDLIAYDDGTVHHGLKVYDSLTAFAKALKL